MSHIDDEQQGINLLQFVAGREEQTEADEATIFVCARGKSRTATKWDKGDLCYVERSIQAKSSIGPLARRATIYTSN